MNVMCKVNIGRFIQNYGPLNCEAHLNKLSPDEPLLASSKPRITDPKD